MFDSQVQQVIDRVDQLRHEVDDHWQIPASEALALAQIVRLGRFQSLCEIGVSYGFSTLHLTAAAREIAGHIHAIDISEKKINAATQHLREAGLEAQVTLHLGDAREKLKELTPDVPFDFVFVDAVKDQSIDYLKAIEPKLAARCVIAADNTATHPEQLAPVVQYLRQMPHAKGCDFPIGNGFELTILQSP